MDNFIFTHIQFIKRKTFTSEDVYVSPHNHNFFEVTYVLSGTLLTNMNGKCYKNDSSTPIIIVPPHIDHSHDSPDDEFKVIYLGFYYNGLHGPLNQLLMTDENGAILEILKKMLEEFKKTDFLYENMAQELQKLFIYNILRNQENTHFSSNDTALKYAIMYIQDHYYEEIDMQELANSLGYSYHHFRHIFKQNFDMPPKQFLLNQRMQYAMRLLRTTKQSIAEISKNCGFSSTNRFISSFKSMFSISPMQYRNSDTVNLDICNMEGKLIIHSNDPSN